MRVQSLFLLITASVVISLPVLAQPGGSGDGVWLRNAYYGEAQTFDKCLGHQPGNGQYHHHAQPVCLRAQLDDNLVTVSTGRTGTVYQEKTSGWKHSPILGWAFDGYPIYGPYGYTDPANPLSSIKRLKSSFQLRNITQRTSLPQWALAHHAGLSASLTTSQYGPDVSDTFPKGRYVEDFDYVAGSGDLDQYNGRFTVTPEFPSGIYAYFVTINDDGSPAFPYIIGMQYYGVQSGNNATSAPGTAQSYFANGSLQQASSSVPAINSWFIKNSQQSARVVSGFAPEAGSSTTWPVSVPSGATTSGSVLTPTNADTQSISYTSGSVYVTSNNLASYTMGPWFSDASNGGVFQNFPSRQNNRGTIPLTPTVASSKTNTGLGAVGLWVNGVAVFNVLDGGSYSNTSRTDIGGGLVRQSSVHVSSASFESGPLAKGSMVSAFPMFGAKLASAATGVTTPVWPTTLGGTSVTITDSAGTTQQATIAYVSPSQVNYRIPESAASGIASVSINTGSAVIPGSINIADVYPNLFFQFNSGSLAAGYITRVRNGQVSNEDFLQINGDGSISALPIDLGPDTDQLYLIIFGSGIGKSGAASTVTVNIGGKILSPSYFGPQGTWAGLDQFNIPLPRTLAGAGKVDVTLSVNGKASNTVNINIK